MPVRPDGRSLAEFKPLENAEQKLLESCRHGELCIIADDRPEADERAADNAVRAAFLRFLILGGDDEAPVDTRGVRIHGAWIEGDLLLKGATSVGDFWAVRCRFDQPPDLREAHIKGDVKLAESHVPGLRAGRLVCDGSFFADGLECDDSSIAARHDRLGLELWNSSIRGGLFLGGAKLRSAPTVDSLSARFIDVGGNVSLQKITSGIVALASANIGGRLDFTGADLNLDFTGADLNGLDNSGRVALEASNMVVKGNVLLNAGTVKGEHVEFKATGAVNLTGATVGGNLDCRGADLNVLDNSGRVALEASNMAVKGNVLLNAETVEGEHVEFKANGAVNLTGATISGNLDCRGAVFNAGSESTLNAERLSVSGIFYFSRFAKPVDQVSLEFAHVGVLADDETAWGERLNLNQFKYDLLANRFERDAAIRLAWLDKQIPQLSGKDGSHFDPQPWRQLRRVFTDAGYAADARKVGIALEDRRHKCGEVKGLLAKSWHLFRRFLNGYGYQPLYVFRPILVIWLSCAVIYSHAAARDKFIPADSSVYGDPGCKSQAPDNGGRLVNPVFTPPCGGNYPVFSPLIYSLNVILPVVDLGQERAWAPRAEPHSQIWWRNLIQPFMDFGSFIQLLVWLETLTGYLAGLYLASVISGLLTSPDDS